MDVSKQAFSERRMIIDPQAYIDINDDLIREIYKKPEELKTFKGYYLTAMDGSIFDLPNYPTIREDFNIQKNNHSHHTAVFRGCCSFFFKLFQVFHHLLTFLLF